MWNSKCCSCKISKFSHNPLGDVQKVVWRDAHMQRVCKELETLMFSHVDSNSSFLSRWEILIFENPSDLCFWKYWQYNETHLKLQIEKFVIPYQWSSLRYWSPSYCMVCNCDILLDSSVWYGVRYGTVLYYKKGHLCILSYSVWQSV